MFLVLKTKTFLMSPPVLMSLQVLHHLRLVKGHSTSQRHSNREVRQDTLDCVTLCESRRGNSSTLDSLPCSLPSVPYTYPITRCLSPAMTSPALLLVVPESRCLFLHPRWMATRSQRPPHLHVLGDTSFPYEVFLNLWSCVVFAVVITYKWRVVWASWLHFSVLQAQCLAMRWKRQRRCYWLTTALFSLHSSTRVWKLECTTKVMQHLEL